MYWLEILDNDSVIVTEMYQGEFKEKLQKLGVEMLRWRLYSKANYDGTIWLYSEGPPDTCGRFYIFKDTNLSVLNFKVYDDTSLIAKERGDFSFLCFDRDGNPWIAFFGYSVSDPSVSKWKARAAYYKGDGIFEMARDSFPYAYGQKYAVADNFNRVWLVKRRTIFCFDKFRTYIAGFQPINMFDNVDFFSFNNILYDSKRGRLYFIDYFPSILIYDGTSWTAERIKTSNLDTMNSLANPKYVPACLDSSGNLWTTRWYNFKHLYKRTPEGKWYLYKLPENFHPIDAQADSAGRIWLAGGTTGLYEYRVSIAIFDPNKATPLSVEDTQTEGEKFWVWILKLYPMPVKETIFVEFYLYKEYFNECKFEVYNLLGQKMMDLNAYQSGFEYNVNTQRARISFRVPEGLSSELYYLCVRAGESTHIKPFIVE